jgi:integrase
MPNYLSWPAHHVEVALTRLQGQIDQNRQPKTNITLGQAISRWLETAKLEDTTRDR